MATFDTDKPRLPATEAGEIAILPLMSTVPFPLDVVAIHVGHPANVQLVRDHPRKDDIVVLAYTEVLERWEDIEPARRVGVTAKILDRVPLPGGGLQVTFQALRRVRMREILAADPYHRGFIAAPEPDEEGAANAETEALAAECLTLVQALVESDARYTRELLSVLSAHSRDPGRFADLIASHLHFKAVDKQKVLEAVEIPLRIRRVHGLLAGERDKSRITQDIERKVKDGIRQTQREFYLRQQLKAIREELGEEEPGGPEARSLRARAERLGMPREVREVVEQQLERLKAVPQGSSEHAVITGYLDWIVALPWGKESPEALDIPAVAAALSVGHHGLAPVKDRVLEYLSVRRLKPDMRGPILCLAGPPGTGKTSIGRAIAQAIGRSFVRLSVGGVRDEAEIRGHRRTYVGALPGRLVQAIRRAGAMNPLVLIDEVDKMARGGQGDPAAALLEVLDPEQNGAFVDHYLDLPLDLSKVMFIATANVLYDIPEPLLDRMEVLQLPGYTDREKKVITARHLLPRQLAAHGLEGDAVSLSDEAVDALISRYTREAGLRSLDRQIESLCRKFARRRAEGDSARFDVAADDLARLIGPPRYLREDQARAPEIGVATGLAWTAAGGDLMFVEAQMVPGAGRLVLTGKLGEVLKESAHAAHTYVRARAQTEGVAPDIFSRSDFHLHFPAGAIPKDGPSAGVAMVLALASRVTGKPVRHDVAVTGEVSLRGKVLPVGGIKEKILAAHRAGCTAVILPRQNAADLEEVPEEVRADLRIILVDTVDDAYAAAIIDAPLVSEDAIAELGGTEVASEMLH